jgi:hypothetical protein
MGQRHLQGLSGLEAELHVVDPRDGAVAEIEAIAPAAVVHAALPELEFDAAILAETAAGRLERVEAVLGIGVPRLLIEKPLEQSRARTRALVEACAGRDARCHLPLRALPLAKELREEDGAITITVAGGAFGLAANGIHWIDLAHAVAGAGGALLWDELDDTPIASGRGPSFRDYGGRAVFGFGDRVRLYLDTRASSPAPMTATATATRVHAVLELAGDDVGWYRRDPANDDPPYRYGSGFDRATEHLGLDLTTSAVRWLAGDGELPTVDEALVSHELLFDLLETSGATEFAIT